MFPPVYANHSFFAMQSSEKKRAVVKEELVSITDDFREAIVLNQLLYWLPRIRDIDQFIREEKERYEKQGISTTIEPRHGWIYKKTEELSEEIMVGSRKTVGRKLDALVEKGFIQRRDSPNHEWDQTKQYRPDLPAIEAALQSEGYTIYTVMGSDTPEDLLEVADTPQNPQWDTASHSNGQSDHCNGQNDHSKGQNDHSARGHNAGARIETTTETTSEREWRARSRGTDTDQGNQNSVGAPPDRPNWVPKLEEVISWAESQSWDRLTEDVARSWWFHYDAKGWPRRFDYWPSAVKKWAAQEAQFEFESAGDGAPSGPNEISISEEDDVTAAELGIEDQLTSQ